VNEIKNHAFFNDIDWESLEHKITQPPFVPKIESDNDLSNIDKMFTKESPNETPDDNLLTQKQKFDDFTYVERTSL
jgi:hypothetical protein